MLPRRAPATANLWPLFAILLLAVGLRAYHLGAQGYWLDELLALEASTGRGFVDQQLPLDQVLHPGRLTSLDAAPPFWHVWTSLELDSHPPAYYLLLRFWRALAGDAEAPVRALSVFFSTATVAGTYFLARRLAGDRAAPWAALLAAVSPLQVFHAHEARNTAMMSAVTLAAAIAALRAEDRPTPRRFLALGALLVAAMLTHYLAAGVLLAIAVYLATRLRGRPLAYAAVTFATSAAAYLLIWGPWLWQQRASLGRNHDAVTEPAAGAVARALVRAGADPLRQLTASPATQTALAAALVTAAFLASLLLLRRRPRLLLAHLWLALPLLAMLALDATTNAGMLAVSRYTFVTAPATFLLIAAAATALPRGTGHALPAAAALAAVLCLPATYQPWKPDWPRLAIDLHAARAPSEPVVIATPPANRWWLGGAVLGLTHYSPDADRLPVVLLTTPATNPAVANLPSAWVITHTAPLPPDAYLPGTHPDRLDTRPFIGAVAHVTR